MSGLGIGLGMIISLVIMVFFILTLKKMLERCSPENRKMQPGMLWLLLIPLFNLIWNFFVVLRMADSLEAEFKKRNIAAEPQPGKKLGLAYAILFLLAWVPFVGIAALICWIIYWVKMAGFSNQLAATGPSVSNTPSV